MEKVTENKSKVAESKVAEPQVAKPQTNERTAEKIAELKAKKKEAAKAWKERKDKEAAANKETAAKFIKYLSDKKVELPEEFSKLLNDIANPAKHASGGTGSLFEKLFGTSPKAGDKVTLMEVFQKSYKSKAEVDRYVKIWAEKGIIVEFKAAANMLESTYTIAKLA